MSELWNLMRVARIARPYALYDASVAAGDSEDVGEVLGNPSVSEKLLR